MTCDAYLLMCIATISSISLESLSYYYHCIVEPMHWRSRFGKGWAMVERQGAFKRAWETVVETPAGSNRVERFILWAKG